MSHTDSSSFKRLLFGSLFEYGFTSIFFKIQWNSWKGFPGVTCVVEMASFMLFFQWWVENVSRSGFHTECLLNLWGCLWLHPVVFHTKSDAPTLFPKFPNYCSDVRLWCHVYWPQEHEFDVKQRIPAPTVLCWSGRLFTSIISAVQSVPYQRSACMCACMCVIAWAYSGSNNYLIPCWLCRFAHLQRMELCIIFIIGTHILTLSDRISQKNPE